MLRAKAATKKYRRYSQSTLEECIRKVQSGDLSVKKASQEYAIPKTTLLDKLSGRRPVSSTQGPSPILTVDEEEKLVEWIFHMNRIGYGQTRRGLCFTVKKILDDDGRDNPFKDNLPGPHWVRAFLRRHPNVSERMGEALGVERAYLTAAKLEKWFDEFVGFMNSTEVEDGEVLLLDPTRIFNCDESGFPLAGKTEKVLAPTGVKYVYQYSNSDRRQITVMACMSAAGLFIEPMLIFPNSRFRYNPLEGAPDSFCIGRSSNGWMNTEVFFEWVANHFLPTVRKEKVKLPVLLLLDGHAAHINLETTKFCAENHIILYCLPAHSSHILQPCDISLFGSLKKAWWAEVTRWKTANIGQVVNKMNFAAVFAPVWRRCARADIAVSGFEAAGLYPLNKDRFDREKLGPSAIFGQAQTPSTSAPTSSASPSASTNTQQSPPSTSSSATALSSSIAPTPPTVPASPAHQLSKHAEASIALRVLEATLTEEKVWLFNHRYEEDYDVDTDALYNSWRKIKDQTREAPAAHPAETATPPADAFEAHLRFPRAPDRPLGRKRKGEELPHALSGEVYRKYMEKKRKDKEDEETRKRVNREKREAAKKKKEEAKKKKKKPTTPDPSSESDDGDINENTCAGCQREYDGEEEDWLGCEACPRWYHRRCTDIMNVTEMSDSELRDLDWQCANCM